MSFKHLFSPGKIGTITLRNRVIMPAMATCMAEKDYTVGPRLCAYHAARARGGCAMNITEYVAVHETTHIPCSPALYDDSFISGFRKLAEAIHQEGGRLCLQLWHAGRQTMPGETGFEAIAPSAIPVPIPGMEGMPVPREMTAADIAEIVKSFGDAARRAKEAGADAVEVHGAHGYLIGQFTSAWSNRRQDEYGGSMENRMRFACEVIREVRRQVGDDYPVLFRMSAEERVPSPDAMTTPQAVQAAKLAEAAGADAIHVSIGSYGDLWDMIPPIQHKPGFNVSNAAAVKAAVSVPVIAVGRINDPALAEHVLAEGLADFVSMGRAQLADPDFVRKAQEGRAEDIVKCIGCNQGCISRYGTSPNGPHLTCMQNPLCGHEFMMQQTPAKKSLRVLVAGGGVAGLTAATILQNRGHAVTLCETQPECGGEFMLASVPPGKQEIADAVLRRVRQAKEAGVEIRCNCKVDDQLLREERPDYVVIAIGASPAVPPIPGVERAVLARDVLAGNAKTGRRVVILGGGLVGAETGEFLTALGKDVTIVEMMAQMVPKADMYKQHYVAEYVEKNQIPVWLNTACLSIAEGAIQIRDGEGKEHTLEADSVVLATGYRPQHTLAAIAAAANIPYALIGDAKEARLAIDAIHEAFYLANEL
ncbi:NAD(P)/FAD-dependent oxidoreductase [Butyricicoccus faecihominis]|uniref:NAD(P)/FAD-dependent oxidoreductase n=1 Tax=Butyricicoccus faecihominis TaxID=1712515 RepID=UPI00247A6AAA|nr:NAD(P)/FAD-dependent oxidoreductase [Butyricicoccus faecihominis]MCQ5129893.1 NAD(P)/FAD-dependent oxidoreductase [Butyricicoccus faecihominis]